MLRTTKIFAIAGGDGIATSTTVILFSFSLSADLTLLSICNYLRQQK